MIKTSLLLLTAILTCTTYLRAYVTNEAGTLGGNNFVSIVDTNTNTVTGYVDCSGFDMTHPIDLHFNLNNTQGYVVSDSVNSVFVFDPALNKVLGKVNDALNPFDAPVVMEIDLQANIAYVTNEAGSTGNLGSVSIIDLSFATVTGAVDCTLAPVNLPIGIGISDDGTKLYVCNFNGPNVTVVNTTTNAATGYVNDGFNPFVSPYFVSWSDSTKAYITDLTGFVNVVDGATDTVTGTVNVGVFPAFVEPVNIFEGPDGTMYIVDQSSNNVYEVDPSSDAVTHIFTGTFLGPVGIGITSDNTTAYVCNTGNNTVSIVDLSTRVQTGILNAAAFPFNTPYQTVILTSTPTPPVISQNPLRPMCMNGEQILGRFATQTEVHNTVSWCASPSLEVVKYNIYRNGTLIGSVSPEPRMSFTDTHIQKNTVYTYGVTAVGSSGFESPAVTVQVPLPSDVDDESNLRD